LFSVAKNHGFLDGNKRTAFVLFDVFLRRNGYNVGFSVTWVDIVAGMASGQISRQRVLALLLEILPRRGVKRRRVVPQVLR
jgi:death-on-curing family protein